MSYSNPASFAKRSRSISRTHQAITRKGAEMEIGPDGLLTVRPRRKRFSIFPVRGIVVLVAVLMVGKALMLAHLGTQSYDERLAGLSQGGTVERVGAFVMQADPVTIAMADYFRPLIK